MPGTPQEVTHAVAAAIGQQSGDALAKSIRVDLGNAKLLAELGKGADLTAMCSMALEEPYDEMLLEHFNHLRSAATGEHINAYAHMERVCVCFQSVFEKDTSWSLPAVHTLNTDLRRAAIRADEQVKENKASLDTEEKLLLKEKPAKLGEAARIIQKNFQITITDRAPVETSKKWGALHVINNLFKIYFQINNLRLCNNLIRAVEGPGFPKALNGEVLSGRSFPIAQLVTYRARPEPAPRPPSPHPSRPIHTPHPSRPIHTPHPAPTCPPFLPLLPLPLRARAPTRASPRSRASPRLQTISWAGSPSSTPSSPSPIGSCPSPSTAAPHRCEAGGHIFLNARRCGPSGSARWT